ncbi:Basic leucine zipper and W2 domain-containing protein 1-A [Xenoophorus captivus]|uniref:Basic leucine zipper and W2 domain-containing protein 1-A n=1 Tax=Xenoophorus captivus TaxID=1517983 RepID=A0ABV0QXL4_9TELE
MNNQRQQKPTLTGQRFKTRKRDEKERFDPSQFQESIVQGLNQSGSDLDAVAKFLDSSGAKLDYRRYAESLFDILVAGGMLGERPYKNLLELYTLLSHQQAIRLGAE